MAGPNHLAVTFDDGATGSVDFTGVIAEGGVFSALADPDFFALAAVHPRLRTVVWPNGADICPDVLYTMATVPPAFKEANASDSAMPGPPARRIDAPSPAATSP